MTAERKQAFVVVAIVLAVAGAMVYAFVVGQDEGLNTATGAAKPFTTDKPRDVTMPIARSEKANTPDFDAQDLASRGAPPKESKMLLMDSRLRERLASNEGERLAMEAFAQFDPAKGVTMLEDRLPSMTVAAEASAVYSALGRLYLQTDPPQVDQALASLRAASRVADSAEAAHQALLAEITLLHEQRGWAEAGPRLIEAHPEGSATTVPGLQLSVLLGKYFEESGDIHEAERVYKETAERARDRLAYLGPEADKVYRQLCLNLSRLYRASGREGDAEKVLRAMRLRLDDGAPPAL